jgi:hypothetical protein
MSQVYGQRPHFDNNNVSFDPVGTRYDYAAYNKGDGLPGYNLAIQYGLSFGNKRKKTCLRRYVFIYNASNNIFNYYKTYKGVRNFKNLDSVVDLDELNARSEIHATEITNENEPTFITQDILKSLFSFPGDNNIFFVEGSHYISVVNTKMQSEAKNSPNFFKIYRYGKIINDKIVVCKNNFLINPNIK